MNKFFKSITSPMAIMVIALFFCLCFFGPRAMAQIIPKESPIDVGNVLEKIPNLNQGAMYSVPDKVVKYCSTLVVFKDIFNADGLNIEVGGAPVYNEFLLGTSYELLKIKDYVIFPLADLIEINIGYSMGVIDLLGKNEFDHGPWATVIDLKF